MVAMGCEAFRESSLTEITFTSEKIPKLCYEPFSDFAGAVMTAGGGQIPVPLHTLQN